MEFERRVTVQAQDVFPAKSDIAELEAFVRAQRVPGELVISYPGNGGRSSIVFRAKPQQHFGEIDEE